MNARAQVNSQTKGRAAEDRAEQHLIDHGLKPIQRNYYCRNGEIDLIMQDGNQLVFIEVRYRKNNHFGSALESVSQKKQQKLIKTAHHYLQRQGNKSCRFDVVGLTGNNQIQWIQNAF